jgi:hypothetical protein
MHVVQDFLVTLKPVGELWLSNLARGDIPKVKLFANAPQVLSGLGEVSPSITI